MRSINMRIFSFQLPRNRIEWDLVISTHLYNNYKGFIFAYNKYYDRHNNI